MSSTARPVNVSLSPQMRDLANGFTQQMYFWGCDVIHSSGNLLLSSGFSKRTSSGLKGTSCYSLPWRGGRIELHGSHAGWFGDTGGFLFIRPLARCVRWLDGRPPVPGEWPASCYDSRADDEMHAVAVPLLDWWLDYETTLTDRVDPTYRATCHRQFKKLPRTRAWLAPAEASHWISKLRNDPYSVPRSCKLASTHQKTPFRTFHHSRANTFQ
jgi:hypothetical protein